MDHLRHGIDIHLQRDKLVSLEDARKLFPGRDKRGWIHRNTIQAWATKGLLEGTIVLATVMVSNRRMTTEEAMHNFFYAHNEALMRKWGKTIDPDVLAGRGSTMPQLMTEEEAKASPREAKRQRP